MLWRLEILTRLRNSTFTGSLKTQMVLVKAHMTHPASQIIFATSAMDTCPKTGTESPKHLNPKPLKPKHRNPKPLNPKRQGRARGSGCICGTSAVPSCYRTVASAQHLCSVCFRGFVVMSHQLQPLVTRMIAAILSP